MKLHVEENDSVFSAMRNRLVLNVTERIGGSWVSMIMYGGEYVMLLGDLGTRYLG